MEIEPISQFAKGVELIVGQVVLPAKLVRSTKKARCDMRTLIDISANKTNKHKQPGDEKGFVTTNEVPSNESEELGCGRRGRTLIVEFKARHVAGYTIPQEVTVFRGTGIRTQNLALIWRCGPFYKTAA